MPPALAPTPPTPGALRLLRGVPQQRLEVANSSDVGASRREAQRVAQQIGFDETAVGRTGIVATELANNLLRHASSGVLLLQVLGQDGEAEVELLAIDRGPGMADVERCLQDGYSTAGTAGTGLGAVARLSSTFDLHSVPGEGTVVLARLTGHARAPIRPLDITMPRFGAICVAMAGELECGDAWSIALREGRLALLVVDGLGHGPLAATAAREAIEAFGRDPFCAPDELMRRLHGSLAGTRGAAAAGALLDDGPNLHYCGVGNIFGAIIGAAGEGQRSRGLVSHNGTLGVNLLRAQKFDYEWGRGSRLIMHSDGLSSRWSLDADSPLRSRHPAIVAALLYRDRARGRDDATIVVVDGPAA